jgi:hypothetical protein
VGHRGLARYYKQRYTPYRMECAAVRHVRMATDNRLYNGCVVNLRSLHGGGSNVGVGGGREGGRRDRHCVDGHGTRIVVGVDKATCHIKSEIFVEE